MTSPYNKFRSPTHGFYIHTITTSCLGLWFSRTSPITRFVMLYRQSLVMDAVSQRHKVRGLYKPLSKPYRDCSQRVTWTLHACVYVSITSPRSDFEGARGSSSGLSWVKHVLDSSSSRGQGMSWAVVSHTCTCLSLQQGLLLMTTENRFLVYGAHLALQSSPEVLGFWAIWHCPHCYIHQ